MANPTNITLQPPGVQSAAGASSSLDLGTVRRAVRLEIPVTAFTLDAPPPSEPPTLTLTIETRADPADPWASVSTLEVEAVGRYKLSAAGLDRYVRLAWDLGVGLDSVTFGASGVAHTVYCSPRDFPVPERSITEISASARADACIAASDLADSYIGGAYTLPLVAWDDDVRKHTARIAVGDIFADRGCDPQGPDAGVLVERDRAIKWFDRLANGHLSPPGLIDSTPEDNEGSSVVVSVPSREW